MKRAVTKLVAGVLGVCLVAIGALAGGAPFVAGNDPSAVATSTIPPRLLAIFAQASAASPCGLAWTLLAAVADTESAFDPSVVSGAGAQGLFQFEPGTFASYARPVPPGGVVPASPFDPKDAAYAAGRYLCSLGVVEDPTSALVAYNCGNPGPACQAISAGYAEQVLASAASYTAAIPGAPNMVQTAAVAYAESQVNTPYLFGGSDPQTGFDCSGLVVWSYGLAGVVLARVANDQWQGERRVALGQLVPGDLVFFGTSGHADHVGVYIGNNAMVDAPHTGADVRIEEFSNVLGAPWGHEALLGATNPVAR